MCTEKKEVVLLLTQNAREMCGGKYSDDAASVACAEVTGAISNVSTPVQDTVASSYSSLALSPSLSCQLNSTESTQITSAVNREHVLEPACPDYDDDDAELFGPKTTMAETDGGTSRRLMLQSADYFLPGFKCRVECAQPN